MFIRNFILEDLKSNDGRTTSTSLEKQIKNRFNYSISTRTIRRYRRKFGYRYRRLRKTPYLTELQKLNRLLWCMKYRNCDFANYIFVDETTIRLGDLPLYHWRLPSTNPIGIPSTQKLDEKSTYLVVYHLKA